MIFNNQTVLYAASMFCELDNEYSGSGAYVKLQAIFYSPEPFSDVNILASKPVSCIPTNKNQDIDHIEPHRAKFDNSRWSKGGSWSRSGSVLSEPLLSSPKKILL